MTTNRNEMFKTDQGLMDTLRGLWRNEGANFLVRSVANSEPES